ncbi:hypothetical protein ACFJGW_03275 [Burkholderiaceae bacterium UC74_6]
MTLLLAVSACSPAFDWREVRPPESDAVLNLPCKPEFQNRKAGNGARMGLAHCKTGGFEFAFSWAELASPAEAPTATAQMREALGRQKGVRFEVRSQGARVYQLRVQGEKPVPEQVWLDFASSLRLSDR